MSPEVPQFVPEILREELLAALATDAIIIASSKDTSAQSEQASFEVKGSVRKLGDQLRFTTHLVDTHSGDTLLTQTLDRPLSSKEVGPRQVAIAVSQVLRCGLTGAAQYPEPLPNETWTGRYAEALETLSRRKTDLSVEERNVLTLVFEALQSGSAQANTAARKLVQSLARDPSADHSLLISALAALGADREALAIASSLIDRNSWSANAVLFEPPLARARQSADFGTIVQRLGLSAYWKATGRLPDFCRQAIAPPVCRTFR